MAAPSPGHGQSASIPFGAAELPVTPTMESSASDFASRPLGAVCPCDLGYANPRSPETYFPDSAYVRTSMMSSVQIAANPLSARVWGDPWLRKIRFASRVFVMTRSDRGANCLWSDMPDSDSATAARTAVDRVQLRDETAPIRTRVGMRRMYGRRTQVGSGNEAVAGEVSEQDRHDFLHPALIVRRRWPSPLSWHLRGPCPLACLYRFRCYYLRHLANPNRRLLSPVNEGHTPARKDDASGREANPIARRLGPRRRLTPPHERLLYGRRRGVAEPGAAA